MRFFACASLVLLTLHSSAVLADAVLKIGNGIAVIAHNGKALTDSDFLGGHNRLQLNDGPNQLLARYSVELNGSDGDIDHSHHFVLLFNADSNQTLTLSVPKIRKQRELSRFNRQGNWILQDSPHTAVPYQHATLIKEGFQLSRDYTQELAVFNQTNSAAALNPSLPQATRPAPAPSIETQVTVNTPTPAIDSAVQNAESMPLQMLKYWYNKADNKSRSGFKAWIAQ